MVEIPAIPGVVIEEWKREVQIKEILEYCNNEKIRVTYGAVGGILGVHPLLVKKYLGARRPEASWIVNKRTRKPTGYSEGQKHEHLLLHSRVICCTKKLKYELRSKGFSRFTET